MERYEESSRPLIILTVVRYGKPIYGRKDYVWYYELSGECCHGHGITKSRKFTIRYFPGDCTYGEESLTIKWENESDFREMLKHEYDSAHLRGKLDHDSGGLYRRRREVSLA